ncbi:MAG TPA: serine hydrolase [Nannocystaceae bacterium]|nr:serine hydrolase [Nannocystaceae bacterium]
MRRVVPALLVCVAACATPAKRVATPQITTPNVQVQIEQHLLARVRVDGESQNLALTQRMTEHRVPGVSIAVFDHYELVWAGSYGLADSYTGEAVRDTTLFQAGSISKSVNALAVLSVAAEGKLDLDAPINEALRSWKLPDNELTRSSPVTLRRLLSHNAGTTVHGFPGYAEGAPVPSLTQVLDGEPPANTPAVRVDVAPGSIVRYSGGGTTITQLALVDTFGEPYPVILARLVLAPLGMANSTYEQPLPPQRISSAAAGHHRDGTVVPGKRHVYPEMAAAGLWTTSTDLARFFAELALARANRSKRVSHSIATAMTTASDSASGSGLGVFVSERNGTALFGHGGADEGFQALAIASVDGYGLVVMANSDNGFALIPEIERTVFAAMGWPAAEPPIVRIALTPAQRDRMRGDFAMAGGPPLSIVATANGLAVVRPFEDPVELVPVSADRLVRVDNGRRYTFTSADAFAIHEGDVERGNATRLPASTRPPLFDLADGGFDDAVAAWKELRRREPGSPIAQRQLHIDYANELLVTGRVDGALVVFRATVAVFPESADAAAWLGYALAQTGDRAGAIASYQQALDRLDADSTASDKAEIRKEAEVELAKLRGGD